MCRGACSCLVLHYCHQHSAEVALGGVGLTYLKHARDSRTQVTFSCRGYSLPPLPADIMKPDASAAYGTFAHPDDDDEFAPSGCDMAPLTPFEAWTTRPAPKFDPSWWWNSIRGAEWFHLYLWMLKDFLW